MILVTLLQARLFKRGHTPGGLACQSGALLVRCLGARSPGTRLVRQRQASVKHSAPFLLNNVLRFQTGSGMPSPDRVCLCEKSTRCFYDQFHGPQTTRLGHQ